MLTLSKGVRVCVWQVSGVTVNQLVLPMLLLLCENHFFGLYICCVGLKENGPQKE